MSGTRAEGIARRRLGRAVLFIFQQEPAVADNVVRADIDTLLLTGRAMDFASRLQGYGQTATPEMAREFGRLAGINYRDLCQRVLPVLKRADVVDFTLSGNGGLLHVDDLVGVTATVIEQTFRVLDVLGPSDEEVAVLHSVEIAAWAPLTEAQHLEQITQRGLTDRAAAQGLKLARAIGINYRIRSAQLSEYVIYNPYVWGTRQVEIATFLKNLPPNERDALLGIFEQASARPGLALDRLSAASPIVTSARKIGLVQAATVKSSRGSKQRTYVFSPLLQAQDDRATTTEALHLRKLFVAHILFGQEHAEAGYGRIANPTVLVRALLNRGQVGPATNISTDYHLLEAAGVVRVEPIAGSDRAILRLIKREIVEGGMEWLQAGLGNIPTVRSNSVKLKRAPGSFVTPERDRASLPDDAAANEITTATILELREEAQRAARSDSAFPPYS